MYYGLYWEGPGGKKMDYANLETSDWDTLINTIKRCVLRMHVI